MADLWSLGDSNDNEIVQKAIETNVLFEKNKGFFFFLVYLFVEKTIKNLSFFRIHLIRFFSVFRLFWNRNEKAVAITTTTNKPPIY